MSGTGRRRIIAFTTSFLFYFFLACIVAIIFQVLVGLFPNSTML